MTPARAVAWPALCLLAAAPVIASLASRAPSAVAAVLGVLAVCWLVLPSEKPRPDYPALGLVAALVAVMLLASLFAEAGAAPSAERAAKAAGIIVAGVTGALMAARAGLFGQSLARNLIVACFPAALLILWVNAAGDGAIYRIVNGLGPEDIVDSWTFDRTVLAVAALLWPAAACLGDRRLTGIAGLVFSLALLGAVIFTDSQSGPVVTVFSLAAYGLVRLLRRVAIALLAAGTAIYAAVAPWFFTGIYEPATSMFGGWGAASAGARLEIWNAAGELALQRPLTGWGVDAMRYMDGIFSADDPFMAAAQHTGASHPHNFALQAWLDLGIAGALIVIALISYAFWRCSRLAPPFAAAGTAMLVSLIAAGSLAPGLWQGWWLGTIVLALCQFIVATRGEAPGASGQAER